MPQYRIRIEVFDEETGEIVGKAEDPLYSGEDNFATYQRAMREFEKRKQDHEDTFYPKEDVEV